MTAEEFRAARKALGLSAAKMAKALEMGKDGGRSIRRWEAGEHPIPGPAAVAVRLMVGGK